MDRSFATQKCRRAALKMGKDLRYLRVNQLRIKQDEMALRVGVSRKTYSKMENGDWQTSLSGWLQAAAIVHKLMNVEKAFEPATLFEVVQVNNVRVRK